MKRFVSCTRIMAFAVSLTLVPVVLIGTTVEAASSVEAARQKMLEEDRKKEEARKTGTSELSPQAKEAGFIMFSEVQMSYADAVAFCKRHNGRLPRINASDSLSEQEFLQMFEAVLAASGISFEDFKQGKVAKSKGLAAFAATPIPIDGFGFMGASWPAGLPDGFYWTGTARSGHQSGSWVVGASGGVVHVSNFGQSDSNRAVCVP